jgi:hypothetical protein
MNFEAEISKLQMKKQKQIESIEAQKKKMSIPGWADKTPEEIKQQSLEKVSKF